MTRITSLLTLFLLPLIVFAQDISGQWNGMLNIQGTQLRLVFNVTDHPEGLTATMDSPDQGAKDIPVSKVDFKAPDVTFEISMAGIKYQGELKGNEIVGTFYQNGMKFPLLLTREAQEKAIVKRSQEPERPFPYYEEQVYFYNKEAGIRLAGTLTLPQKKGKFPAAIMISGSGPQNRDEEILGHKPFLIIADYLTHHGYAVLRFDDRGTHLSEGDFSSATSMNFATDVESAYQYLLSRDEIKSNKIGLIGHSEGGLIAPLVAANNKNIAFIISLAGPGLKGDQILLLQQSLISEKSGMDPDLIAQNKTINSTAFEMINTTNDTNQLKSILTAYLTDAVKTLPTGTIPPNMSEEDFVGTLITQTTTPWMLNFIRHDPAPVWEKVKCPVLALNGAKDLQVPAEENISAIQTALAKGKNKKVKTVIFPELNHLFQECNTGLPAEYEQIDQTFAPIVLDEMVDWLRKWVK